MDSILDSVKKSLGILEDYDHFDPEIIMAINSAFFTLNQLGVGPSEAYHITDSSNTWDEFIVDDNIEAVKSYIPLKVKLLFDPPSNGTLIENINKQISEFEFRLMVHCNNYESTGDDLCDFLGIRNLDQRIRDDYTIMAIHVTDADKP